MTNQGRTTDRVISRPTLKTVAQLADLSVATVSRALANDPKIAKSTRKRVNEFAASVDYIPDRAAQRLRTGKTKVISLILDPHQEILGFGNSLIIGLTNALRGTDYHLNITPHFLDDNASNPVEYIVRNQMTDGIIFSRTEPFDARVKYLLERKFPFVSHGRTDLSQAHSYVDFDNQKFSELAVNRLHEKGCKKLCILLPPDKFCFHQHLKYGFLKAVRNLGIEYYIPDHVHLDDPAENIGAWAKKLADAPDCPDGFVCPGETSYLSILGGLRQAKQKTSAPEFVVKATTSLMQQIAPDVDRIQEDICQAGQLLGQQLLAQLKQPNSAVQQHVFSPVADFNN